MKKPKEPEEKILHAGFPPPDEKDIPDVLKKTERPKEEPVPEEPKD